MNYAMARKIQNDKITVKHAIARENQDSRSINVHDEHKSAMNSSSQNTLTSPNNRKFKDAPIPPKYISSNRCILAAKRNIEANARLVRCIAESAENFRICTKCDVFMDTLKIVDQAYMGPSTDEWRSCREQQALSRLTAVLIRSNSALFRYWNEARCRSCFDQNSRKLNNEAKMLMAHFGQLRKCLTGCTNTQLLYSAYTSDFVSPLNASEVDLKKCNDLHRKVCNTMSSRRTRNAVCHDVIDEWILLESQWKTSLCFQDTCSVQKWSNEIFFVSLGMCVVSILFVLCAVKHISSRNSCKCCNRRF